MGMHKMREKSYDSKDSFYEELEQVFDYFHKDHVKILILIFIKILMQNWGERILSNRHMRMTLYIRIAMIVVLEINFATSKNLVVQSIMFLHRNIHKCTCTSPDGKTHNKIHHILSDRRWHSSIFYV